MFKIKVTESKVLPEVKLAQPKPFHDYRGEMWTFWEDEYDLLPPKNKFKISKFTRSRKNVLRGLHGDEETWKHVSCVWGEIYLVVVDNRPHSVNYLKWDSFTITDRNHLSVLIPPGFVNGHICLSEECLFHYAQSYPSSYVDVERQDVLKWNDVRLDIDWPTGVKPILSERDR
jgi:dTDP-4-dehydrorhamnose 3,5-epimerase